MRIKSVLISITLVLALCTTAISQQPKQEIYIAPNAPKDKPVDAAGSEVQQILAAIKPLPDELSRMMLTKPSGAGPSQVALEEFIKREYPGFFKN